MLQPGCMEPNGNRGKLRKMAGLRRSRERLRESAVLFRKVLFFQEKFWMRDEDSNLD